MKISGAFAVALLVGSASASKSAKVGVTCKNLDVNSLTPKALAYAAKAVEMTFNDVHNKETAHAVAVGSFPGDSSLRTKSAGLAFSMVGADGSAIRQAAWESELTSVLAKAPYTTLSSAKGCSIDFAFDDAVAKTASSGAAESGLPVVVEVKCDNLDFSDLTASALASATAALKSTYNAVHSVEGDGRSLSGVQIDGPRVFSDFEAFVKAHHCTMCRRDDDAAAAEDIAVAIVAGQTVKAHHCTMCRRDDDELAEHNVVFTALNVGAHHCTMCRRDDDASAEEKKLIEEKDLDAWQDMFVATLHKDASGTFKDVSQCAITMSTAGKAAEVF